MALVFDKENIRFRKVTRSAWGVTKAAARLLFLSLSVAVGLYALFAIFIDTDTERALKAENKLYERLYPEMLESEQLLSDVIGGLKIKDDEIYEGLFHTQAPSVEVGQSGGLVFGADTIPDRDIVSYTAALNASMLKRASAVDSSMLAVFSSLAAGGIKAPMTAPVGNMRPSQAGASVGERFSPFYKIQSNHPGLDIIAGQGTPVLAAADGVVRNVTLSGRGQGNVVELDHGDGFVTRYAHLSDVKVSKGQRVLRGKVIAKVGISGNTLAPHLHYEVLKKGVPQDPLNYMFLSLSPQDYFEACKSASAAQQSLD